LTSLQHRGVAWSVAVVVTACAEHSVAPGTPKAGNLDLAPYTTQDDCFDLVSGDRLDYRFESNEPVKFNISYRDSGMVIEPIIRDAVTTDSGVFAVQITSRYCLTWEAGAAGALINYHAMIRERSQ